MASYKTFVSDTLAMLPAEMKRSFHQMSVPVDLGDNRFPFWPAGRAFLGKTFRQVYDSNAWVVNWARSHTPFQRRFLQDFKEYVHTRDNEHAAPPPPVAASTPATQPPDGDTVVQFGKYKGNTFQDVYMSDPDYINFIVGPDFVPKPNFRQFLNMHALKGWATAQREEEIQEEQERRLKEDEERRVLQAENERKRMEDRERRKREEADYLARMQTLQEPLDVFLTQDPPMSSTNDGATAATTRLMYTGGKQLALLPGRMNLLPATQWRKQQELFPYPLLKYLFDNTQPSTIYTFGKPWFPGREIDGVWRWNFPRIVLHSQVNIRLWKITSSGDIKTILLPYEATRPEIQFLVWQDTTYVVLEREEWLKSAVAHELKTTLKTMVALDSDQLQNTTQRVITQLWQYFKRGNFGPELASRFIDASDILIDAYEEHGEVSAVENESVTIALNASMEKYWQIYVHKRKAANEAALNAIKFRKKRLEFIEYVCQEAKRLGVPCEVLYLDAPDSYTICADTSLSTLAFIGLGVTTSQRNTAFKGSPLIAVQVPLEIDPNTGRRAIGIFMQPMYEDIRDAISPTDSAFRTAHLPSDRLGGTGLAPWDIALTLIQANWDGPKNFRQKLFPSISRNDPNWFAYMRGCGLLTRQSFREEWPDKSDALKSTMRDVLHHISAYPPSAITWNVTMAIRGQFEKKRDEMNRRALANAEKRRKQTTGL